MYNITNKGFVKATKHLKADRKSAYKKAILTIATLIENRAKANLWKNKSIITGAGQQSIINKAEGQINRRVTVGKKYLKFVEYGRGPVTAKKSRLLWIPISLRAKKSGHKKGMQFGKDYVLTKKVKRANAKPFFRPAVEEGEKAIRAEIIKQLKKIK